jgi:eukaryotic-like serine/threonine-protein kinase
MGVARAVGFVRFGPFQLDLRAGELRRNGIKVRVPDQSIKVLEMLVEHSGEVVTREELHEQLWPNGTIVEFDRSINAAVKRLRQALEDTAEAPKFIETLPRRGYRFLMAVDVVAPAEAPVSPTSEPRSGGLVGQPISHYRVVRKLGHGSMGVVYEAEDTKLGRRVALKFLPEELSDDLGALERFEREARAASALNHPNICTIYEVDTHEGVRFIAMEYVAGNESLRALLRRGSVQLRKIIDIAVQLADGMAAAHSAGITHRDLKPENIMVTSDERVKILDFGLARQAERAMAATSPEQGTLTAHDTQPGTVMGTVNYMSPEQARGFPVNYRSDQFSFGLILYELVSGTRAFQRETKVHTLAAIISEEPAPIEAKLPPPCVGQLTDAWPRNRHSGMNPLAIYITIFEPSATTSPKPTRA